MWLRNEDDKRKKEGTSVSRGFHYDNSSKERGTIGKSPLSQPQHVS